MVCVGGRMVVPGHVGSDTASRMCVALDDVKDAAMESLCLLAVCWPWVAIYDAIFDSGVKEARNGRRQNRKSGVNPENLR